MELLTQAGLAHGSDEGRLGHQLQIVVYEGAQAECSHWKAGHCLLEDQHLVEFLGVVRWLQRSI